MNHRCECGCAVFFVTRAQDLSSERWLITDDVLVRCKDCGKKYIAISDDKKGGIQEIKPCAW